MTSVVMGHEATFLMLPIWVNSQCLNVVSGVHHRKSFNPSCSAGSPISIVEADEAQAEAGSAPEVARMI
jgi:hypothetical protein